MCVSLCDTCSRISYVEVVVINNKNNAAHKSNAGGGCEVAEQRPYAKLSRNLYEHLYSFQFVVLQIVCKIAPFRIPNYNIELEATAPVFD